VGIFQGRNNKALSFVFFTCLLFTGGFFAHHFVITNRLFDLSSLQIYRGNDAYVHRERAQEIFFPYLSECGNIEAGAVFNCSNQPPLFHVLAAPFVYRDETFYFFSLLFIGVLIPLILYAVTREPWTPFFYFTVTNFFYIGRNVLTSELAMALVLLFFVFKKPWQHLVILYLLILAHPHGFYLGLGVLFLIYLFKVKWWLFFPSFLPGCSGQFKGVVGQVVNTELFSLGPGQSLQVQVDAMYPVFKVGDWLSTLFWNSPLPFFLIGVWGFVKEREFAMLFLLVGSVFLAGLTWRFNLLAGLFCVVGTSFAYKHAPKRLKRFILIAAVLMGLFQLYNFSWEIQKLAGLIC